VIYIERYESYCEIARHNFKVWGANTVEVMQGESMTCLDRLPAVEVFYVDPARRGDQAQRVYALADCEPNLPPNLPRLMAKASFLIAKLSPMIDITRSLALLPHTKEVHILSVKNECKEVLFVVGHAAVVPQIICVNLHSNDAEERFVFEWGDEQKYVITPTSEVGAYLFEPNASVLKAGAFKSVASRFDCLPLHVSSHLYTANEERKDFPGRHFKVQAVIPYKGKNRKQLGRDFPKANITIRNFPLSVVELRQKTKIKEGGDDYLFATTLANEEKVIIHALKC